MTRSFDLDVVKVTVILSNECDSESIIRLCSGEGELERKAFAVSRFLVSLELARMTRSFDLDVVKVTVILNNEERM
ncbi:hypothetical protein NMR85_001497 [Vibrio alginolyticus]|nr:hypothetical protein [Vibrio alginolyticus]